MYIYTGCVIYMLEIKENNFDLCWITRSLFSRCQMSICKALSVRHSCINQIISQRVNRSGTEQEAAIWHRTFLKAFCWLKILYRDSKFTYVGSWGSSWYKVSIDLCHVMQQCILWVPWWQMTGWYQECNPIPSWQLDTLALPTWWRHQMETCSALLALCAGNSRVTGELPLQSQWCKDLMFYLIWAWTNGWVNNRDAGDLRRNRTHYDVTVMSPKFDHFQLSDCWDICQPS